MIIARSKYLAAPCIALALAACSGTSPDVPDGPAALSLFQIQFAAPGQKPSRSIALEDAGIADFAVFGEKVLPDGSWQYVFSSDPAGTKPYVAQYDAANGWRYAGLIFDSHEQLLKYWDLAASAYNFYACAPYIDAPAGTAVSFTGGLLSISGLAANTPAPTVFYESSYQRAGGASVADFDLLSADPQAPYYEPRAASGRPAMADIVPLPFHPILSRIVFQIYNTDGRELDITHFTAKISDGYELVTSADYTAPDIFAPVVSAPAATIFDGDLAMKTGIDADHPATLFTLDQIPQTMVETTVDVTVTIAGKDYSATIPLGNIRNNFRWSKDQVNIYVLALTIDESIILADVEVSPWTVAAELQAPDQTNW